MLVFYGSLGNLRMHSSILQSRRFTGDLPQLSVLLSVEHPKMQELQQKVPDTSSHPKREEGHLRVGVAWEKLLAVVLYRGGGKAGLRLFIWKITQ